MARHAHHERYVKVFMGHYTSPGFTDTGLRDTSRFILHRTVVVEGRIVTLAIIEQLKVVKQGRSGLLPILKCVVPGPFIFERTEEALDRHAIVAVSLPAPADPQDVGLQERLVRAAGVLNPLVCDAPSVTRQQRSVNVCLPFTSKYRPATLSTTPRSVPAPPRLFFTQRILIACFR